MNFNLSKRAMLFGRLLLLSASLLTTTVLPPVLQPPAAIAAAPYFKTPQELDAKWKRIKLGWTRQQVESLLGKYQWGDAFTYNYYVVMDDGSKYVRAVDFNKSGRVSKLDAKAG